MLNLTIIADFFTAIGALLTGLLSLLIDATSGIVVIFYDSVNGGWTIYGIFLLIGIAMFFLMFAWKVIQGFIRK